MKPIDLESKKIKNLTKDGVNYYSVVDSINEYFNDKKGEVIWVKIKPEVINKGVSVIQLIDNGKMIDFVNRETAIEVIKSLEPANLNAFDSMLDGLMKVPKPPHK